jgi:hypothetical protein
VSMNKSRLTIVMCGILMSLLFSMPAFAEYKRDYTVGKKSFEDAEYADAIKKLKSAIADNPNPAARVKLYGMRFDSYLPHFYLGQAYFKTNDCPSALESWEQAIAGGVIQKKDEFSRMQADMQTCQSQTIDVSSIAAQAGGEIDTLDAAINSYAQLQNESLLAREWSSRWEPRLNQARQVATTLRQRLDIAVQDVNPDAIESINSEARRASSTLSGSERDALAQVQVIQSQNAEGERVALETARRSLQDAIRQANATEKPQGGSSQMNTLLTDLNRQVGVGESLGSTASELNINEQTQIIKNVLRRYNLSVQNWQAQQQSIARRTPPEGLKKIAEAYFAGDYEATASLADPEGFKEDRARIQALLFRAAANHKLYVRSGEDESETLRQVKNDIRAIKRMNSGFSPYIAAFSPSFISLFRQTG